MGSNYIGVDSFSPQLTLQTDDDSPSAAIFRVPNERLLDNDVHLAARAAALEGVTNTGRVAEIFDDFSFMIDNTGATVPHFLGDSGPWRTRFSGVAFIYDFGSSDAASVGGGGILRMRASGGAATGYLGKEGMILRFADWRMRALVKVETTAAGMSAEFGFVSVASSAPGNASGLAVTAYFNQSVNATNWLLRTRAGGADSIVNTGVAVNTSAYQRLELGHNGTTWTLSVSGSTAVTAGANAPAVTDEGWLVARAGLADTQAVRVDMIHARSTRTRW